MPSVQSGGGSRKRLLYQIVFLGSIPLTVITKNLVQRVSALRGMRPRHVLRLCMMLLGSVLLSPVHLYESIRWRRAVARVSVQDPIFVIGHWRSGTTHFHYLLSRTSTFGVVTMLQASFPGIFLTMGAFLRRHFPLPESRPMDMTRWTLGSPQEEEIALSKMVQHSFFTQLLTPNTLIASFEHAVLLRGNPKALVAWKKAYSTVLKKATLAADGKALILKNPANTGRIAVLLEMFPDARFVYVHRHPYEVFQSMNRFYRSLFGLLSLQDHSEDQVIESTLSGYEILTRRYLADREQIPAGHLLEVYFDDLVRDPVSTIRSVYEGFGLEGFEESSPRLQEYLRSTQGYRAASTALDAEDIDRVDQRWGFAFDAFGYPREGALKRGQGMAE